MRCAGGGFSPSPGSTPLRMRKCGLCDGPHATDAGATGCVTSRRVRDQPIGSMTERPPARTVVVVLMLNLPVERGWGCGSRDGRAVGVDRASAAGADRGGEAHGKPPFEVVDGAAHRVQDAPGAPFRVSVRGWLGQDFGAPSGSIIDPEPARTCVLAFIVPRSRGQGFGAPSGSIIELEPARTPLVVVISASAVGVDRRSLSGPYSAAGAHCRSPVRG